MTDAELARIRADAERVAITRGIYEVAGPFHGEAASQYLQACIGTRLDLDAMALMAEVERLKKDLAWYRGRAERAESIVVGLASTLSKYCGFDPGTLIQVHATDYEKRTSTTTGGPIDGR